MFLRCMGSSCFFVSLIFLALHSLALCTSDNLNISVYVPEIQLISTSDPLIQINPVIEIGPSLDEPYLGYLYGYGETTITTGGNTPVGVKISFNPSTGGSLSWNQDDFLIASSTNITYMRAEESGVGLFFDGSGASEGDIVRAGSSGITEYLLHLEFFSLNLSRGPGSLNGTITLTTTVL